MAQSGDVGRNIAGAWRLMTGQADGVRLLDVSADGFWNSFFAIVVALPALAIGWIAIANELSASDAMPVGKLGIVARLAVVDMGAWIIPLIGFALVVRPAGLASRFIHYVVATNWGSVIVIWLMLPPAIVRLVAPAAVDVASLLSLALFGLTMALTWRLTTTIIGKGPAVGSAVFAGMFVASLAVLFALQALLGIDGA